MSEPRGAEASAGRWALLGAHVLFPIHPSLQALLFLSLQNNLKNSGFQPHLWPLICSQLRVHLLVSAHLIYLEVSLLSRLPIPGPAASHPEGFCRAPHRENCFVVHLGALPHLDLPSSRLKSCSEDSPRTSEEERQQKRGVTNMARSRSNLTAHQLCDLGLVTQPLCASASSSEKRGVVKLLHRENE